jgi:hypothetical protein
MRSLLFSLLLALVFGAGPARAEWLRAQSPNFIVYSEESEGRLRERITLLENFDRLLRVITTVNDPPAPARLHIYVVSGPEDLRTIHPAPPGIVGYYVATPYGIAALVDRLAGGGRDREARDRAAEETLLHEYAHHFMRQYRANAYPAWYVEGFAEYFATATFRNRSIDIGNFSPGRAYSIVEGQWLPIDRVLFGTVGGLSREQMSQFYAQSWLLTHYFYSTAERQAALRRYLVAARSGDRAALEQATGLTAERLSEELRRYIRGGQIRYRRLTLDEAQAGPAITVARLPAAAGDMMLFEAKLRIGLSDEEAPSALERMRAAAARHPGDPLAQRVLAHAEALHGEGAAADRLLDPLIASAPGDAELMYYKGLRHLRAARESDDEGPHGAAARTWFTRAHRADQNHFQTLYRYAEALRGQPGYVSENTENVLLLAHQLAPQVAEVTMNAAIMLINRRKYAEAEALLRPLSVDPHNSGLAEAALQLIERARSQAGAPPEPASPTN